MKKASGPFEVKLTRQPAEDGADPSLARLTIAKQFHGALDGTSHGQMLSAGTAIPNSAGYVAIERVTGTLDGRRGAFTLQHHATMTRGTPALTITVVPDSGTDQLEGLTGSMDIVIEAGKHAYVFDYALPESHA
jgi:hypothetical protein